MSSNPKNNLLTIHMRKTKKRVTAAGNSYQITNTGTWQMDTVTA